MSLGRDTNMASIKAIMQQEMQNLGKVVQNEMRDMRQMVQKEIQEMHQQTKSDHADLMSSLARGAGPQRRKSSSSVETAELPPVKSTRTLSESITPAGTGRSSVISLTTALEKTTSTHAGVQALADKFPAWKDMILKLKSSLKRSEHSAEQNGDRASKAEVDLAEMVKGQVGTEKVQEHCLPPLCNSNPHSSSKGMQLALVLHRASCGSKARRRQNRQGLNVHLPLEVVQVLGQAGSRHQGPC